MILVSWFLLLESSFTSRAGALQGLHFQRNVPSAIPRRALVALVAP